MSEHDYETIIELGLTDMTKELGITDAKVRRCKKCRYENTYVNTKNKEGFLFKEEPCKQP